MKISQALLSVVTGLALVGIAHAGDIVEGHLNAMGFRPIAKTQAVSVRLLDDSLANKTMKERIEASLAAAGFTVRDGAPLVLTFETGSTVGNGRPVEDDGRFEFHADGTSAGNRRDEYSARYKVFTTKSDQDRGSGAAFGGAVRVDFAIDDRSNGQRLWQGWATADSAGRDTAIVSRGLIAPLVAAIGTTARQQPISGMGQ